MGDENDEVNVIFDASSTIIDVHWTENRSRLMFKTAAGWSLINPDGSGQTSMSPSPPNYGDLDVSIDGTFVVGSAGFPERDLFWASLESGGAGEKNLTDSELFGESLSAISPDGTKVVYVRAELDSEGVSNNRESELWVVDVESGAKTLLKTDGMFNGLDWSSDGKIVYARTLRDGAESYDGIYVMDAEGGAAPRVTPVGHSSSAPAWSPDGSQIAYIVSRKEQIGELEGQPVYKYYQWIEIMDADGSNPRAVTAEDDFVNVRAPDW